MSSGFDEVVVVVEVVVEDHVAAGALGSELAQAVPIPRIELREVVLTEAVGGGAVAAASPRHFVEGRTDVSVGAVNRFMVVAPAVVPEARPDMYEGVAIRGEAGGKFGEIFGEAGTGFARYPTCGAPAEFGRAGWYGLTFPPGIAGCGAKQCFIANDEMTIGDEQGFWGRSGVGGRGSEVGERLRVELNS